MANENKTLSYTKQPFDECGKILIPTNDISYKNLDLLINRAKENNIEINLISNNETIKLEEKTFWEMFISSPQYTDTLIIVLAAILNR